MNTSINNSKIQENIFNLKNIKYVCLANKETNKIIGEMPSFADSKYRKIIKDLFDKICKDDLVNIIEDKNKIKSENGFIYSFISSSKIIYFVITADTYLEKRVYEMLDDLKNDNIHLLIDEKGELNEPGKQSLKHILIQYDNKESEYITDINININEMKYEMQDNIRRVITNTDTLHSLDDKAVQIKENSNLFKKDSTNLRKKTWKENIKWLIVLIFIIVFLLLIIFVPLIVRN